MLHTLLPDPSPQWLLCRRHHGFSSWGSWGRLIILLRTSHLVGSSCRPQMTPYTHWMSAMLCLRSLGIYSPMDKRRCSDFKLPRGCALPSSLDFIGSLSPLGTDKNSREGERLTLLQWVPSRHGDSNFDGLVQGVIRSAPLIHMLQPFAHLLTSGDCLSHF